MKFSNETMSRVLVVMLALICAGALSACVARHGGNFDELALTKDEVYRVRAGDILRVEIWGEPALSGDRVVRDDGQLNLPLIKEVPAAGMSVDDLTSEVEKRYTKFIQRAQVTLSVTQTAPIRYYLLGKFNRPGEMRSASKINLLQAIATGGGFLPFANQNDVILIRNTPAGEKRYSFDFSRIVAGTQPNPEIIDGDTINVP